MDVAHMVQHTQSTSLGENVCVQWAANQRARCTELKTLRSNLHHSLGTLSNRQLCGNFGPRKEDFAPPPSGSSQPLHRLSSDKPSSLYFHWRLTLRPCPGRVKNKNYLKRLPGQLPTVYGLLSLLTPQKLVGNFPRLSQASQGGNMSRWANSKLDANPSCKRRSAKVRL